jgi:ATP-dependent Lhr-like helicase
LILRKTTFSENLKIKLWRLQVLRSFYAWTHLLILPCETDELSYPIEYIIGVEGEKTVNSRDFYSVFKSEENFKVINAGNTIGEIPFSPQIREDENILLAAKIWKIKFVDSEAKKIEVVKAVDGKKPMFFGGGGSIHPRIREKMFEILFNNKDFDFLDQASLDEINQMRKSFSVFNIKEFQFDRPLLLDEKYITLYTFTGTKINRTINFLLNIAGIKNILEDTSSSFEMEISKRDFFTKWDSISRSLTQIDKHISDLIQINPAILDFSKWAIFLPEKYKISLIKEKYFDFENAMQINSYRLSENTDVFSLK